jgi:DNA modification methylase
VGVKAFYDHAGVRIINSDCREALRDLEVDSVDCCITSPPYWGLRDYGVDGQIGLEETHEHFVSEMVGVFREVRRVLRPDGTLWLNLGDSYAGAAGGYQGKNGQRASRTFTARIEKEKRGAGLKPKDLVGIPWRVALALQADGWWLRADIVWHKPNPMPESVADRPTRAHEYVFLLAKSDRYHYDGEAIREPLSPKTETTWRSFRHAMRGDESSHRGVKAAKFAKDLPRRGPRVGPDGNPVGANKRSVWTIASEPFPAAHFATFPTTLVKPMILAGCRPGGVVLDPFAGTGTTLLVAKELGRRAIGIELNHDYCAMAVERLRQDTLPLTGGAP